MQATARYRMASLFGTQEHRTKEDLSNAGVLVPKQVAKLPEPQKAKPPRKIHLGNITNKRPSQLTNKSAKNHDSLEFESIINVKPTEGIAATKQRSVSIPEYMKKKQQVTPTKFTIIDRYHNFS